MAFDRHGGTDSAYFVDNVEDPFVCRFEVASDAARYATEYSGTVRVIVNDVLV
jgi:hypothetical protein